MRDLLAWLTALPPLALYLALGVVAALENVFPPIPADTVVALGAFLSARGSASPVASLAATFVGNIAGAAFMYWLGRRYGAGYVARRVLRGADEHAAEQRLRKLYARYGVLALVVSRFLPGFRALVPPLAGALRLPALGSLLAMGVASFVWYGAITWLAYSLGRDFDALLEGVRSLNRAMGIAAAVVAVAAAALVLVRWRRRRASR